MTASEPTTAAIAAKETASPSGTNVNSPKETPSEIRITASVPASIKSASDVMAVAMLKTIARLCWSLAFSFLARRTRIAPSHGSPITSVISIAAISTSQRGNLRHIERAEATSHLHREGQSHDGNDRICDDYR